MTDRKHRREARGLGVVHQLCASAVQKKPMTIETGCQDGMILPHGAIANQYKLQVTARKAGFAERYVFGDRVILAIAFSGSEGRERRTPPVRFAVLGVV